MDPLKNNLSPQATVFKFKAAKMWLFLFTLEYWKFLATKWGGNYDENTCNIVIVCKGFHHAILEVQRADSRSTLIGCFFVQNHILHLIPIFKVVHCAVWSLKGFIRLAFIIPKDLNKEQCMKKGHLPCTSKNILCILLKYQL